MNAMISYRGIDGRGTSRTGRGDAMTAAEFAEACYGWGWREVVITNEHGLIVGEVGVRNGKRGWWGEQPATYADVYGADDEINAGVPR